MAHRIAHLLIRFSGKLLISAVGLAALFAVIAGVQDQGVLSFHSLRLGVHATLMLMMQMEPPDVVLKDPTFLMAIFGWFICTLGWLVVPLLVGAVIDVALGGKESESELRVRLYHYFRAARVPEEQLDSAVEETVKRVQTVIRKG